MTDNLRALLEAAADAPWSIVPYGDGDSLVIHHEEFERVCFMATPGDSPRSWELIKANAALIVALRNGAADLLSDLNTLRARADAAEARVAEMVEGLKPFADLGELIKLETEGFSDDDDLHLITESGHLLQRFAVRAFRRADALLQEPRND